MNDSQFDDFVNDKLKDLAAPVPAGLWEKVAEGQFDQFIGGKLRDHSAPVPEGLWEKIAEHQFDQFVSDTVGPAEAPVPSGLWDRIADGQFDAFVAGKLDAYEAPVPEGLWEKVKPKEEDDDRTAFFWFRYPAAAVLILALLTAGAVGGYLLFSQKNKTTGTAQSVQNSSSNTIQSPPADRPDNNATVPPAAGQQSPSTSSDADVAQNPAQTIAADPARPSDPVNNRNDVENTKRKNGSAVTERSATAIVHPSGSNNRLAPPARNTGWDSRAYDIVTPPVTATASNATANNTTVNAGSGELSIAPYQPGYTDESTISQTRLRLSDLSNKQLSANARKFRSVIICPSDKGNKDWYLETYLSPDLSFKTVTGGSATPLYMAKKDSVEHSRIGFSAGVRLVKPITDNFLVKAGLQFTQANEKYVYRTENEIKTTTVITVRTIIRAPGDTVVVQDTSVLQTAGFKTNSVTNRVRSIDIPLTVGYQFGNEDLKFGINAGVVVNLTTWYQGMVLDSTYANVPLNKSGNGIYRTNMGLGLIGSVSIVKRLSDDLHIFAEPYFRYSLKNRSTDQAGFNQRVHLGGLAVGLRFNLNRY